MVEPEFVGVTSDYVYARNLSFIKWCSLYVIGWKSLHYLSDSIILPKFGSYLLSKLIDKGIANGNEYNYKIARLSNMTKYESALFANYLFSLMHSILSYYLSSKQINLRQCELNDFETSLMKDEYAIKGDLSFVNNSIAYMIMDTLFYELLYNQHTASKKIALIHHIGWLSGSIFIPMYNHGWSILYWFMWVSERGTILLNLYAIIKRFVKYIQYFEKEFDSINKISNDSSNLVSNLVSNNNNNITKLKYSKFLKKWRKYESLMSIIFSTMFIYIRLCQMPPTIYRILYNKYINVTNYNKHKYINNMGCFSASMIGILSIVWGTQVFTKFVKQLTKHKNTLLG